MNDQGDVLVLTYLSIFLCMYIGLMGHFGMMRGSRRSSVSMVSYLFLGDKAMVFIKLATLSYLAWKFCIESNGVNNLNLELIWAKLTVGRMDGKGLDVLVNAVGAGYLSDSLINNMKAMVVKK